MNYFRYLYEDIHTVIAATVDVAGLPATCAVDIMDFDEKGLYFLTAKGKSFYRRLKNTEYIALTGIKGEDTTSSVAVSVRGKARELGNDSALRLIEKNPYMNEIYPFVESKKTLTAFQLYEGVGEWFDLSKKPVERESFSFGASRGTEAGYFISGSCTKCRSCEIVCPQTCIEFENSKAVIRQENCLRCGACLAACPHGAVSGGDEK